MNPQSFRCAHRLSLLLATVIVSHTFAFDINRDEDVDLADFFSFRACASLPRDVAITDGCRVFDVDGNGAVELLDFAGFQQCFTGADESAAEECLPLRTTISAPDNVLQGYETLVGATVENGQADISYLWTVVEGDATVTTPTSPLPRIVANDNEPIELQLVVRDSMSDWVAVDHVTLGVATEPLAPDVDIEAIPGLTVQVGDVLLLKAHASDPLGIDIAEISWTLADGPFLPDAFTNPTSVSTNFNTCCAGSYQIASTVRNALGEVGKTLATINVIEPEPLNVTIVATPGTTVERTDIVTLEAMVSDPNAVPIDSVQWSLIGGPNLDMPFTNPTSISTNFNTSLVGMFTVSVTVENIFGVMGSDSVVLTVEPGDPGFSVTAGADRVLSPNSVDFGGSAPFAAGAQLQSGLGGGQVPGIMANVIGNTSGSVAYFWEKIAVPDGADLIDVTILNSSAQSMTYLVIPALSNTVSTILDIGVAGANTNTVVPGEYRFRVTAQDLMSGEFDSVEVSHTLVAPFAIPASPSPGSLQGLANAPQELTNYVIAPNSRDHHFRLLSLVMGTLQFALRDAFDLGQTTAPLDFNQDGAINATDTGFLYADFTPFTTLNSEPVMPTAGDIIDVDAEVAGTTRGTYILQAALAAGPASVGYGPSRGFATYHAQSELPASLDVRPNFVSSNLNHFGLVNSTTSTSNAAVFSRATAIHGARAARSSESWWNATAATCCDINGDGFEELLLGIKEDFDGVGGANDLGIAIVRGVGADPTVATNSPLDNSPHNFGSLSMSADGADADTLGDPNGSTLIDVFRVSADVAFGSYITDLACCDLDNDGRKDLVLGEPSFGSATQSGRAHIYYGTANDGFFQNPWATTGNTIAGNGGGTLVTPVFLQRPSNADTDFDLFGYRLACCDYNNDGVDDLVTSAPGGGQNVTPSGNGQFNNNTGAIYGFAGSIVRLASTTVNDMGSNAGFRLIPTIARSGDFTGAALCCDDVNGDGVADIVYGAPGRRDSANPPNENAGAVLVLNGGNLTGSISTVSRIYEGNAAHLGLGRDVVATDFNGDGSRDLVISALVGDSTDGLDSAAKAGRVFFIPSTVATIQSSQIGVPLQAQLSAQPQITGATSDANIGVRLCAFDFNQDGRKDIFTFGSSTSTANNVGLLIEGNSSFGATVTASTTLNDAFAPAFRTPSVFPLVLGFDPDGVLYTNTDACLFCDVNGDQVADLFFSGHPANGSDAYAIYGALRE